MITTTYDPQADAMYIYLAPKGAKVVETREVEPGIHADVGEDGKIVGIEVLDVSTRTDTQRFEKHAA